VLVHGTSPRSRDRHKAHRGSATKNTKITE
jgi:hypothetical protein